MHVSIIDDDKFLPKRFLPKSSILQKCFRRMRQEVSQEIIGVGVAGKRIAREIKSPIPGDNITDC